MLVKTGVGQRTDTQSPNTSWHTERALLHCCVLTVDDVDDLSSGMQYCLRKHAIRFFKIRITGGKELQHQSIQTTLLTSFASYQSLWFPLFHPKFWNELPSLPKNLNFTVLEVVFNPLRSVFWVAVMLKHPMTRHIPFSVWQYFYANMSFIHKSVHYTMYFMKWTDSSAWTGLHHNDTFSMLETHLAIPWI